MNISKKCYPIRRDKGVYEYLGYEIRRRKTPNDVLTGWSIQTNYFSSLTKATKWVDERRIMMQPILTI